MPSARSTMKFAIHVSLGVAIGISTSAIASGRLPNGLWQFVAGDAISAEEVNSNFAVLSERIDNVPTSPSAIVGPSGARWNLNATYCGRTTTRYDGRILHTLPGGAQLTGYAAARAICETSCAAPGGHMCTSDELIRSRAVGFIDGNTFAGAAADTSVGWYSSGIFADAGSNELDDCRAWTTNLAAGVTGATLYVSSTFTVYGSGARCSDTLPLLCCR